MQRLHRHVCFVPLAAVSKSQHRERPYRAGRSPHWIKVKNRKHASLTREF
jgi:bifunctional non-homologous end joining protein LigD